MSLSTIATINTKANNNKQSYSLTQMASQQRCSDGPVALEKLWVSGFLDKNKEHFKNRKCQQVC